MARQIKGAIVEHTGNDGRTYRALRFTAYGQRQYVSLGPVSEAEAKRELRHVLADVERGTWCSPKEAKAIEAAAEPEAMPTFRQFAGEWWVRNEQQLAPSTQADYQWRLAHLLPSFADYPLDSITFDAVERYIAAKLAEDDPLAARSINMTLVLLAAILDGAVERELIPRNPAKGKHRRVRERAPRRTLLDTAEQIAALLAAAGELDAEARRRDRQHICRRAILATLVFAGLRIGELCALRWRDVDLANGWLHVGEAKTDAGRRRVKIRGALLDELKSARVRSRRLAPDDYVFATSTGGRPGRENMRNRVLRPAVKRASERLVRNGSSPLPDGLTPHSLRRSFASVAYALGEDPPTVMAEMGHTTPALALAVYARAMRRDDGEKARLRALVDGAGVAVDMPRLPFDEHAANERAA